MIKEDYVSFETAKKLKEKGFPQDDDYNHGDPNNTAESKRVECLFGYYNNGEGTTINWNTDDGDIACPTLSLVQKWLREEKNIYINIDSYPTNSRYLISNYNAAINVHSKLEYSTYEKALEAGINKALELI